MSQVVPINLHLNQIEAPSELSALNGWLIWRYESEPGTGKQLKVPYYPNGGKRFGRQGNAADRAKLTTFAAARTAAVRRGFTGVGLALMPEFGVVALDFDHCVGEDKTLPPEVLDIVSRTYAEYSPSGAGIRAFLKGDLGNNKSFVNEDNAYGFESFSSNGFVTFTGRALPFTTPLNLSDTIAPVDEGILALCRKRFGDRLSTGSSTTSSFLENYEPPVGVNAEEIAAYLSDLDPSMGRDGWVRVGMAIHHETDGEGFDLWDEWSAGGQQYPGTDALQTQWSSFDRRDPTSRQITMRSVLKMSAEVRTLKGEPPRSFDEISRAAEEARENNPAPDMTTYRSSDAWEGRYRLQAVSDFANRPPPRWIIKGLLPEADLAVLFGASGAGKSFVALDVAIAIALGRPWRGCKVRQGRVVYIAAEGGGGVSLRLQAYAKHNAVDLSEVPMAIIHDSPNLLKVEDIKDLVAAVVDAGPSDLIICDTFAQMTPGGNENSGEDMGLALKHARSLRDATGAMIMLVHHSGKDAAKGARGWSGLRAAADAELEVVRDEDSDVRLLRVSKQKDGRDDLSWAFKLEEVSLGLDDDLDEITSVVVVETEMPSPEIEVEVTEEPRRSGEIERAVIDFIARLGSHVTDLSVDALTDGVLGTLPSRGDEDRWEVLNALFDLSVGGKAMVRVEDERVHFLSVL